MSYLDVLPVELLYEIYGHLLLADKKAFLDSDDKLKMVFINDYVKDLECGYNDVSNELEDIIEKLYNSRIKLCSQCDLFKDDEMCITACMMCDKLSCERCWQNYDECSVCHSLRCCMQICSTCNTLICYEYYCSRRCPDCNKIICKDCEMHGTHQLECTKIFS
jgi:hypothetical protein